VSFLTIGQITCSAKYATKQGDTTHPQTSSMKVK